MNQKHEEEIHELREKTERKFNEMMIMVHKNFNSERAFLIKSLKKK